MQSLHATGMLKIAGTFILNVASIVAVITTLSETPQTYVEWKIDKFIDLPTNIDYLLSSPTFSLGSSKWLIQMYPNGQMKYGSESYIGLYLAENGSGREYRVNVKLGFKQAEGSEFNSAQYENTFNKSKGSWGWPKLIKRSSLLSSMNTAIPGGTLIIFCKARIVKSLEVVPEMTSLNGTEELSDNLKELYTSKHLTDVKLIVGNIEFPAHKNLLACRSSVFKSMFTNSTDEVEITDSDPDSFEDFLLFLYTGKLVDVPSKKAMNLYKTAYKYNIQELMEKCAQSIAKHNLSIDTFYDILLFAKLHNDSGLLKASTDFFISNAKLILLTEKFEKFLANDPLQGNKLFLSYVEMKNADCAVNATS